MELPQTLISRLASGRIVPFVGAGVSTSVKSRRTGESLFPSWRKLLDLAADRLDNESKGTYAQLVRNLLRIDPPNYLRAAEYARESLGPVWFEFLKSNLDPRREMVADDSLDLAKEVWNLGSELVVTTNYDRVLRWSCPRPEDLALWSIEAPVEQAALLRHGTERPTVWHLHGDIDDSANLILTPDGYERLYSSPESEKRHEAALATLRSLLASHSFLFIGFSLEDEAFGIQLRAVNDIYAGASGPHYALVHLDSVERLRDRTPSVELITFPDYGVPLLDTMRTIAAATGRVARERTLESATGTNLEIVRIPVGTAYDDHCDTPPPTSTWVGRVEELGLMQDHNMKVVALTGIGGQGKSTLAAKFLETIRSGELFWDWRDCKEESNTLHTQLVRIIERITKGHQSAAELAKESTESIIKVFFDVVTPVRGLFVFDNMDQYVDVTNSRAIDAMNLLIEGAIKSAGASRFVFTCRPRLIYDSGAYLQIELGGLSVIEAEQLFRARGVTVDARSIQEVHELTQGHPLWLNLIATQVLTNRVDILDLIARIKSGKDAGLPNAMLREIWRTLKPKHQKLLRYLAETVRPETEKRVAQYVARELNYNQFTKALRQLRSLDLIVVKSPTNKADTVELHPLVREFVRRQFSQSERSPYISAIILFFDQIIVKFRPTLSSEISYSVLENWTNKAELLMNSGQYVEALAVLHEARFALLRAGYTEEFVRLAVTCFGDIDPGEAALTDSSIYDDVYKDFTEALSQLGRYEEAEDYITRFEKTVNPGTARHVAVCQMWTYFYWTRGNFDRAKEWGKRGVEFKSNNNLDTRHDCAHDLALAQRDSGEVEDALKFFLQGTPIDEVTDPQMIDKERGPSYYGNIGRCLFFKGDDDKALICYIKSAWSLEQANSELVLLNQGWAALWIGELFERKKNWQLAYVCYRRAANKWRLVSPPRAEKALQAAAKVAQHASVESFEDWQVEREFFDWLNNVRSFA